MPELIDSTDSRQTLQDKLVALRSMVARQNLSAASAALIASELKAATASFIATVSHELRTPLTPVLACLELLQLIELPEDVKDLIEIIRRNAKVEARLLDDLLDLNRIGKTKIHLHRQPVDLATAIHHSLQVVQAEIDVKQLKLTIDCRPKELYVNADPDRLQQALWNVIKNAVKFTPVSGKIFIAAASDAAGNIVLTVRDTGVGIRADLLPKLFEPFEQGDRSQLFGGLGVGLSIAKGMIELHGGTIAITSPGESAGTTVTLSLPSIAAPVEHQATAPIIAPAAEGVAILLVEDHLDTLKLMGRLLQSYHHRVVPATSVKAALAAAEKNDVQLLVSDIGLPDGTGFDLMHQLRHKFTGKSIALTGYGMDDDIRRCQAAGFARHITKPIDFQKLQTMIAELAC